MGRQGRRRRIRSVDLLQDHQSRIFGLPRKKYVKKKRRTELSPLITNRKNDLKRRTDTRSSFLWPSPVIRNRLVDRRLGFP